MHICICIFKFICLYSGSRLLYTVSIIIISHFTFYLNFLKSFYIYYGARAKAGGTCLVAVLHTASVIGCGVCALGAVRYITLATPAAHPQHPMTLGGACNTATRHVTPALALAP